MKILHKYITLVGEATVKRPEVLALLGKETSKLFLLYKALRECDIESPEQEDAIAIALYGKNANRSTGKYKTLKSKLYDRLRDVVFLFTDDHEKLKSGSTRGIFECQKSWAAVVILSAIQQHDLAVELSYETLLKAEKLKFAEGIVNNARTVSRICYMYYSSIGRYQQMARKADLLFEKYNAILLLENKGMHYYNLVTKNLVRSFAAQPEEGRLAIKYYQELMSEDTALTPHLRRIAGLIHVYGCQLMGDFKAAIAACDEHLNYFNANPKGVAPPMRHSFLNLKANYCLQMGDFEGAKTNLAVIESSINANDKPWFNFAISKLRYLIQVKQYDAAEKMIDEAQQHPLLKTLSTQVREELMVFETTIQFLAAIEKGETLEHFDIVKFHENVQGIGKDKEGIWMNIAFIQILYTLHLEEYQQKIAIILEGWENRIGRINSQKNPRIRIFYKMLLSLGNHDFKAKRSTEKNANNLQELGKTPVQSAEIVPYEAAWAIILSQLN
jgi:tetratricopeptide (TPR) repeat protein